jgi:hypothetical protein
VGVVAGSPPERARPHEASAAIASNTSQRFPFERRATIFPTARDLLSLN